MGLFVLLVQPEKKLKKGGSGLIGERIKFLASLWLFFFFFFFSKHCKNIIGVSAYFSICSLFEVIELVVYGFLLHHVFL